MYIYIYIWCQFHDSPATGFEHVLTHIIVIYIYILHYAQLHNMTPPHHTPNLFDQSNMFVHIFAVADAAASDDNRTQRLEIAACRFSLFIGPQL